MVLEKHNFQLWHEKVLKSYSTLHHGYNGRINQSKASLGHKTSVVLPSRKTIPNTTTIITFTVTYATTIATSIECSNECSCNRTSISNAIQPESK